MIVLKVLVACECSGVVRDAFREAGHDAVSCDLKPTKTPGPHVQGDVTTMLSESWDLVISHPPCTYLSRAGARWLYPGGELDGMRYAKGMEARAFFVECMEANAPHVAVENPLPMRVFDLPQHSQTVQPFEFGHPYSKRTHLWLRGLPPLMPTDIIANHRPYLPSNTGGAKRGQSSKIGVVRGGTAASRTFTGIAKAMADQWGHYITQEANA